MAGGAISGGIEGVVRLQGRDDARQVEVSLDDRQQTVRCTKEGSFHFGEVSVGEHTVEAAMAGYLPAQRSVMVEAGKTTRLPGVLLLGGDVYTEGNSEGRVDIADLALIGANFNTTPPRYSQADLNGDNIIDIYDLVMAGVNFGKTESPWWDEVGSGW